MYLADGLWRLPSLRLVSCRLAQFRSAPLISSQLRFASVKSILLLYLARHVFHTSTPCNSCFTCFSFAIALLLHVYDCLLIETALAFLLLSTASATSQTSADKYHALSI